MAKIEKKQNIIIEFPNSSLKNFDENEKIIFKNYKFIPIDLLIEANWNYKDNDQFLQEQLKNNIKRSGQIATCNVRQLNTGFYEVVDGNHRLRAFQELGMKYVACYDHGKISQAEAIRIALEKNETRFKSDEAKMNNLLKELSEQFDFDELKTTMPFNEDDLSKIINDMGNITDDSFKIDDSVDTDFTDINNNNIQTSKSEAFNENNIIEDNFDEPLPILPKSKLGDLYELNNHRLMCGDSTSKDDVQKLMNGRKANLLNTDPPYNVNYTELNKNRTERGKDWSDAYCSEWKDNMSDSDYEKFIYNFILNAKNALDEWAHYYIWHASTYYDFFKNTLDKLEIPFDKIPIIWVKNVAPISYVRYWRNYEPCIFAGKGAVNGNGKGAKWYGKIGEINTWMINKEFNGNYIHPTQKPLALAARAMHNSTQEGELVLDLFGGSGSTLISADIMNRICYSMELEPKFMDMIVLRYMKYCKQNDIPCTVKLNGEIITRDHFEYPDSEIKTNDEYDPQEFR